MHSIDSLEQKRKITFVFVYLEGLKLVLLKRMSFFFEKNLKSYIRLNNASRGSEILFLNGIFGKAGLFYFNQV